MVKIISWNVNSINSRLDRAIQLLKRQNPDYLCIQELKCVDEKFPYVPFKELGYCCTVYGQKAYNGVAILSKETPIEFVRGFEDGANDSQARFLLCKFKSFSLASVYVPNGQEVDSTNYKYKLDWFLRLKAYLKKNFKPSDPLVLGGDFNVALEERDVHDPEGRRGRILFSDLERQALKQLLEFGLKDTFRQHHLEAGYYSWWDYRQLAFSLNRGMRIDYLFATKPLADLCFSTGIDKNERKGEKPSDHAPCLAEFSIQGLNQMN